MTFIDAIKSITRSSIYDATKRPSMGGYVHILPNSGSGSGSGPESGSGSGPESGSDSLYTIAFRERENSAGSPVDHSYVFDAQSGTWASAGIGELSLDGELLTMLLGTDWQVGKVADFELARDNSSNSRW